MEASDLISRVDAVREALQLYRDARETVRKCREAEDDFGTLAFESQMEAFRWMVMVLMALPGKDNNAPTKEQSEPLTIEQLREMDGEPVWVVLANEKWSGLNGWYLVHHGNAYLAVVDDWELDSKEYGVEWIAYRRPPEKED